MSKAYTAVVTMTIFSVLAQCAGIAFLPASKGYTEPRYTALSLLCFMIGIVLMARIIVSGVNLSVIMPIIAASIPLISIAIGIIIFGEAVPLSRLAILIFACLLIGLANLF